MFLLSILSFFALFVYNNKELSEVFFMKNVAIIGAGACGLACCMYLSKYPDQFYIQLFEKNNRIGRKIAATGNGRCNLSNANISKWRYQGDVERQFPIIETFNIQDFCSHLGIATRCINDLYYPYSEQAKTLIYRFEEILADRGVITFLDTNIIDIAMTNDRYLLTDQKKRQFKADIVIVAVGGKAAKMYGTDGSSFNMLKRLGLHITPLYPSLVQLKTKQVDLALKGSRVHGTFELRLNQQPLISYKGEILFTDDGVSGIAAMQISRLLKFKPNHHYTLHCNFIDELSQDELKAYYQAHEKQDNPFLGIVGLKLAEHLNRKKINCFEDFYRCLSDYVLEITNTRGFDSAQVTRGGVMLEDLDDDLMIKQYSDLYIGGETLNIDGDCGGFNLHAAFATGKHIAKAVIKKYS